jgi:hypothetical protein
MRSSARQRLAFVRDFRGLSSSKVYGSLRARLETPEIRTATAAAPPVLISPRSTGLLLKRTGEGNMKAMLTSIGAVCRGIYLS